MENKGMENEELDLVEFFDEDDNKVVMEVIDYFFYEGDEYAVLTEYVEDAPETDEPAEAIIMKIQPIGEDEEEFLPIDEKLAEKLIELYQSGAFEGDFDDEDEE